MAMEDKPYILSVDGRERRMSLDELLEFARECLENAKGGETPTEIGAESAPGVEVEDDETLKDMPELLEFVREHPDVFELPSEVVDKLKAGMKLSQAYAMYENEKLREQLSAVKQNERNAQTAPGSALGDAQGGSEVDELLAIFNSVFK